MSAPGRIAVVLGIAVLAIAASARVSSAQMVPAPTWDYTVQVFNWSDAVQRNYRTHLENQRRYGKDYDKDRPAARTKTSRATPAPAAAPAPVSTITTPGPSASRVPSQLAASYPAASRAEAERTFTQLLGAYSKIEDSLGVRHGDAAAAIGLLLVVAYEIYRDTTVDTATYPTILEQTRAMFVTGSPFHKASAADRRVVFEQMAIVGMLLASAKSGSLDAAGKARLHDAARNYLAQLKLDPDKLRFDANGMSLAP